ncbi:MAG: ribulose-phosphate 3-epimerase [Actinobacteria bacterium]|nr:ribulose-phosphate 3-epimerase [Actinomycetota bacterium]
MAKPARLAASILNADFARLGEELAVLEPHLDFLHLDIMDGHFVPNLSFGPPVIASLRRVSRLFFDAHLMVTNPMALFADLKAAGADLVSVHLEVHPDPTRAAKAARGLGLQFGLVINPPTPFEAAAPFLELCDLVLVMSVNPGFGGQGFIPEVLEKVEAARMLIDSRGLAADVEIDGGITPETARLARRAGADAFVAGTAVVRAPDPVAAVQELRAAVGD